MEVLEELGEERERLKKWGALAYLAKIEMEAGPALEDLSAKYMQTLKAYLSQLSETPVETKVQLDTDLSLIQTIKLLHRYDGF